MTVGGKNIPHCLLRNKSSDLKSLHFNQKLCESTFCDRCGYPYEDYHNFLERES